MVDDAGATTPGPSPSAIYTETLARLYWRQGFLNQALDIYRHLAQTQPDNKRLQEQMAALLRQLADTLKEQAAENTATVAVGGGEEAERCCQKQTRRVLAHLERWLHQVRQQRLLHENTTAPCR